jgi:hypothetical protein
MKEQLSFLVFLSLISGCALGQATDGDVYGVNEEELTSLTAPGPRRPLVFGRDMSEGVNGVPIHGSSRNRGDVSRSLYAVRVDDLARGERLRLRGQVMLSFCGRKDILGLSGNAATTPCTSRAMRRHPYHYAPRIHAAFVISDRREGGGGRRISDWFQMTCTERKHHCALSIPEVQIDDLAPRARGFVKLVVAANAPDGQVRDGHVMEVERGRGGLYVTRELPHLTRGELHTQSAPRNGRWMGIDQTEDEGDDTLVRRVIFRVKLRDLEPGDVVSVDGRMRAEIRMRDGGCDPLINTEVILTRRRSRQPHGGPDTRIAARNGTNCTDHSGSCVYEASGAARVGSDAPSTMYASFVAYAKRSCAQPNGRDTWHAMRRGSHFTVRVRSADPDGRRALRALPTPDVTDAVAWSRYWNPTITDHFYTIDRDDAGAAFFGYRYETSEGSLFPDQETGTVPLFQYFCGDARGDHFYTIDALESELVASTGCDYEGIAGYAFPTAQLGTVALHRYWNLAIGDHFYTVDRNDDALGLYGYVYEGVAAFVQP